MPVRSAWLINRTETESGQSRSDTRLAPTGSMAPTGALTTRSGVLPGSPDGGELMAGLTVSGDTEGMTAVVGPGRAVVQGVEAAGAYPVVLTDHAPLTFADGDASNPRTDLVVLRVYDAQFDTSNRTEAVLEVIQGAPAATPEPPQAPVGSLPLAHVAVPAGASVGTGGINWQTGLTDLRRTTVAVGGVIPLGGTRDEPGGYPGQYRDTDAHLQRWDGTHWSAYPRQVGGVAPQGALATGEYTGQYRDEGGRLQRWDGALWRPAVPGSAYGSNADGGYCKSVTWVESVTGTNGPTVTVSFVAPVSGAVLVHLGFQGNTGVDNTTQRMSANIRKDGVLLVAADETRAAMVSTNSGTSVSTVFRVTGLQAGATYTAVSAYQSSSANNNGWFDNRFIRVDPVV